MATKHRRKLNLQSEFDGLDRIFPVAGQKIAGRVMYGLPAAKTSIEIEALLPSGSPILTS